MAFQRFSGTQALSENTVEVGVYRTAEGIKVKWDAQPCARTHCACAAFFFFFLMRGGNSQIHSFH